MSAEMVGDIPGGPELLKVHAFEMTSEVDARGYFICTRHVVVSFKLSWVSSMELDGFNHQNALDCLKVGRTDDGEVRLDLEPAHGLGGFIQAREVEIAIEPGIPAGSQYLRAATDAAGDA